MLFAGMSSFFSLPPDFSLIPLNKKLSRSNCVEFLRKISITQSVAEKAWKTECVKSRCQENTRYMFKIAKLKEAVKKSVVYLMLFVMAFNTVACDMQVDTKLPVTLNVSPSPGLHEYPFDGTGGVSGQVQTLSASYVAQDGTTSTSVRFDFPDEDGITVQSNEGNGFASFIFTAPGYYVVKVSAIYNGKPTLTQSIHYNITSSITALGLKTNKDDANIGQTLRMMEGDVLTLIPVYTPSTSGTLGVTWEADVSNGVIRTEEVENQSTTPPYKMEKQLKITALEEGTTTIRAISNDNSDITKEITVVVSAKMADQSTEPSRISINTPSSKEIRLGETAVISATVYDGYNNPVSGQEVRFEIEDESVFKSTATTSSSVTLQAVGGGESKITAYFIDKNNKRTDSSITLSTLGAIEKLSITPYFGILLDGEEEVVPVEYYPADTVEKGFEVTIQNTDILALTDIREDSFTLKPLDKGQTQITVKSTSDPAITATATVVVDVELSNVDRITKVAFDQSVLNFASMQSQSVSAYTYVRNLQGRIEPDTTLGLKFTNKNPDIVSIQQSSSNQNSITITPLRPTEENEKAVIEVRSSENDSFYDELTVYVEGNLVRLIPDNSSVDLLMGTDGSYTVEPYPQNAVFALAGEDDSEGKAIVSIDNSNTASITEASLVRNGSDLRLDVKAGNTPGVSTITFLKNGEAVGSMEITTTVADDYVKSITTERGGSRISTLSMKQDSDPVQVSVSLINDADETIAASASAYDYTVADSRIIDVSKNENILTITPKNAGETYITLTATSSSATSQLYVEVGGSAVQGDTLRSITLSKDSSTLSVDRVDTVNYTILPYSLEDETTVTVQASDPEVVQISHDAENRQVSIVGKKAGSARLTFTAQHEDVIKSVQFNVKVQESGNYYSIILDRDYLSYDLNQRLAQTITATVYKNGVVDTSKKVNWTIEDSTIGSVTPSGSSNGRSAVVGYKDKTGTTKIVASLASNPDVTASTILEVIDSHSQPTVIRNIVLSQSSITLPLGRTSQIGYSIVPSSLSGEAEVTFSSDNESVATVDESGKITTHAIGDANISATVDMSQTDGEIVRDSMRVNVVRDASQPSYIELSDSSVTLDQEKMDEGTVVTASVYDSSNRRIDDAAVEWKQSVASRKIVRVEEGENNSITLYPVSAGVTTIRASYPGLPSMELQVIVGEETAIAKSVETLNPSVTSLDMFLDREEGRKFGVYVTPVPADVTNILDIEWTSTANDVATVIKNPEHPTFATINAEGVGNAQIIAKLKDTEIQAVINISVTQEAPGKVTAIEVSPTSIIFDLNSRELTQLRATVYYDGVIDTDQEVTWKVDESLDGAVVAQNTTGQYLRISKGNKTGEGYITATAGDKSASAAVEVVESADEVTLMSLSLSASNISINEGQKTKVYANPYPSSVADLNGYQITWTSVNDEVASVDNQGVITGVASGNTQIEAKASYNGTQKSAILNVTVYGEDTAPSYIGLSDSSVVLDQEKMDEATEVSATVYDRTGNPIQNAEVTWNISSYAQRFVRMEEGDDANTIRLYPVSAGSTMITASYPNLPSVNLLVTVGAEAENAKGVESLLPSTNRLDLWLDDSIGQSFNVYVTPVPADVTNKLDIEWSSSDQNIVTVIQNASHPTFATVNAVAVGNAQVIAKVKDTGIQAVIDVSVTQEAPGKITAIEVSPSSIIFDLNSKELTQIKATVYFNGVADNSQKVTWTVDESLDGAIVYEDTDSQYLRISKGNATGEGYITATAGDMSASTAVEVVRSGSDVSLLSLSLSSSNLSITPGQKIKVYANPYPSSAADQAGYQVTWSSADSRIASVDSQGIITGVSSGTTQIEAKASYNGVERSAIANVTVLGSANGASYIALSESSLLLNQEEMDKATTVTATVYDRNNNPVQDAEVEWNISSYSQRFIRMEKGSESNSINVYPVSAGLGTITASYQGVPSVTLTVSVGNEMINAGEVKRLVPSTNSVDLWLSDSTGQSFSVYVTPVPANVTNALDIEWSTTADDVATVTKNPDYPTFATINATGVGNAQIIAKLAGSQIQAVIDVSVTQNAPDKVTAIVVEPSSIVFDLNSRALTQIEATVYFNGVEDDSQKVSWDVDESLDEAIVYEKDDENTSRFFRLSKGNKTGEGYITATAGDKSAFTHVSTVDSTDAPMTLASLTLSMNSLELGIGQKSIVYATPYPSAIAGEPDYTITWESSDEDVVTVDNGYLTGAGDGVATVSAKASYGGVEKIARLNVRVSADFDYPSRIILSPSNVRFASSTSSAVDVSAKIIMASGSEYILAEDEKIEYSINDESIVNYTPSEDGTSVNVSPKKEGDAVITASYDTLAANLSVEVGSSIESPATAPTKITLNSSTGGIMNPPGSAADTTTIISVEYLPQNLANEYKGVSWSLDSEDHAKILFESEHTVTLQAVSAGEAVLSAESLADSDVKASIKITVLDDEIVIPRISLDRTNLNMDLQDSVTVNALVTKNGVTEEKGSVTFTNDSTDDNITFQPSGTRGYTITTDTEQPSTFTVSASYPVGVGDTMVSAMLPVTVEDSSAEGQPLREVMLSEDSLVMAVGESRDLDYSVEPKVAVTALWKTSNPDIVSVDQNGLIEAIAKGNAEVSVEVTDEFGITLSDVVRISVTDEIRQSSRFSSLEASENSITRTTRDLPYKFTLTLTDASGKVDTSTDISEVKAYGVDGDELTNGELFKWSLIGSPTRTVELSDFKPGSAYLRFTVLDDELADGPKAGVSTSVFVDITGDVKAVSADTQYLHMAVGDREEINLSYSPTTAVPESGNVTWTIENSKPASGSTGAVLELIDTTANSATIRALALGTATVKISYGTALSTTVEVSVEDIASLSGGIKKITFDNSFLELGYPYTRTEVGATVHFYDGTTTREGITYAWSDTSDSGIANIMASGDTCYITPVSDGTATLVATYGSKNALKAEMQVFVKGSISELTPSADTMTIYTGGSARVSITPDIEDIPNTRYGWKVVKEEMTSNGVYIEKGDSMASALTSIMTDPNDDNSSVVIAAKSVITDPDDSRYDKNLADSYPRKVTIQSYLIDKPDVTTDMTVIVELLPVNNSYPTELDVDFSKVTSPNLESYNVVTGTLLDSNGEEVDGHIDWYYYGLGDDGWDETATGDSTSHETTSWLNPNILTDNIDVKAYTEENAKTLYLKPQKYGIYRLKAICRENPQLQQSVTINIEGEVDSIIDSVGGSLDITENGDWVTISASFDPEPVLKRDAFFVLGSYKQGKTNGAKSYNEDNNMRFIVNGNSIQIFGKAVTSEPMPLFIEYWDSATRVKLDKVLSGEDGMTYEEAIKGGNLIATTTVMVRVVPPGKSIATISVSGLDISIDPSSVSGPINFNVSVSGGQWGNTGADSDNTFNNWEWLEVDIIGSDSANAGQDVIYASTTPSRVNAPASIAQGGRINFVNGTASFTLVKNAIPNEPLMVRVDLKDDYQDGVINNGVDGPTDGTVGTVIFDIDTLDFNKYESIVYIGGQVTNLNAGTTEFTNNGTTDTATGQVINMITGAMATIKVEYNPSYTHQKGTVWYTPEINAKDRLSYSYISNGNTNECSVDGAEDSGGPVVLRAMSIYDPWFDYRAEELGKSVEVYRSEFLAQSHETRLESTTYRYPNQTDKVQPTIYLDFQVTVSRPIDKAVFTVESQRQTNKETGLYPSYVDINDPVNHPDIVSESDIYCYDTSDASSASLEGGVSVDAYYISADLVPDYGYSLTYNIVKGKEIGTVDAITDIDDGENAFRFIPKGRIQMPDGTYSVSYGDVVVRATSAEHNFSQDFRLHYLPSNMRVVKYIGETTVDGIEVPSDTWTEEWDVITVGGYLHTLYGMEAIVLQQKGVEDDPDVDEQYTSFPFSIVNFGDNTPYYITNGVPSTDADGGESVSHYAVKFAIMQGENLSGSQALSDIAHFESPTGENLGNETEFLTNANLKEPYVRVVADKQGVAYISYTIISVDENGDQIPSSGTMAGGIMLYVISPMNQVLAHLINDSSNAMSYTYGAFIPEKISKAQNYMWYLGASKGGIGEAGLTSEGQESGQILTRGRTYASFTLPVGETISGSAFDQNKEIRTMKELGESSGNPSIALEINSKALSNLAYEEDGEGNVPSLSDVIITGDTGLSLLGDNGISSLAIADIQGGLYRSNIINGKLDLSGLKSLKIYQHTGMDVTSSDKFSIVLPPALQTLTLTDNNLDCTIDWNGSGSTLTSIDLSGNSFKTTDLTLNSFTKLKTFAMENSGPKSVTISNATALTEINVESDRTVATTSSKLTVTGSSKLATVDAENTQFTDISVQMGSGKDNEITLGKGSSEISKISTLIVTSGNVDTIDARGLSKLVTINAGKSDVDTIKLSGTKTIATIRVNSIRDLDLDLDKSGYALSEFAFNKLASGASIDLREMQKLTNIGKGKNSSFSYNIPAGTELILGSQQPGWSVIDEESGEYGENPLNKSKLVTVKLGTVDGKVDLANAISLDVLETGTGNGEIDATMSGLQLFDNVSTGVKKLVLDNSRALKGEVTINGGINESIQELSMNYCPITSINITASSKILKLEAYGSKTIKSCDIQAFEIEYIDMHEQSPSDKSFVFGTYQVRITYNERGSSDSNDWNVSFVPKDYTWGLPKLEWLELHGCGISYYVAFGDKGDGGQTTTVRIGNGIAEGTALSNVNTWSYVGSATIINFNEEKYGGQVVSFWFGCDTGLWASEPWRRLQILQFG